MDEINDLDIPVFLGDSVNDDSWPAFDAAIAQIESQETAKAANNDSLGEKDEEAQAKAQEFEGILHSLFTLSEGAISKLARVDFAFDERGKQDVISATVPVLNKYGSDWLDNFKYLEEATLLIAVFALGISSRKAILDAKAQQQQEEIQQGEHDAEEAA